jgi:hypothetical protein
MPRQVCPTSAKVQLNNGILARRVADWDTALAHFKRARQIEPTYCEPDYWAGLSLLNANRSSLWPVHHAEALCITGLLLDTPDGF